MSWRARAVLAATAGAGLVGAGALAAAYAADPVPSPTPSSLASSPSHDPQVDALTNEAKDLQSQVAALERAVADERAQVRAPATAPSSDLSPSPEPVDLSGPANVGTGTAEPSHQTEHEAEVGGSERGGSDD